jgi:hypothetical protein
MSILKVVTCIITIMTVHSLRLAAILVIMSVSTFKTNVILYLRFILVDTNLVLKHVHVLYNNNLLHYV